MFRKQSTTFLPERQQQNQNQQKNDIKNVLQQQNQPQLNLQIPVQNEKNRKVSQQFKENLETIQEKQNDIDKKLYALISTVGIKKQVLNNLNKYKLKEVLEIYQVLVEFAIEKNDMIFLLQTIDIIGQTYEMFGDLKSATFSFITMRDIANLGRKYEYKITSMISLGNITKKLKKYSMTLKLYKRALQYCWLIGANDIEYQIYDKIGVIYYLKQDIAAAKEFHLRYVNGMGEEDNITTKISNEMIKTFEIKGVQENQNLDKQAFSKCNYFPYHFVPFDKQLNQENQTDYQKLFKQNQPNNQLNLQDQHLEEFPPQITNEYMIKNRVVIEKQNPNTPILYSSTDEIQQIEAIFLSIQDFEFDNEIPTPRLKNNTIKEVQTQGFSHLIHKRIQSDVSKVFSGQLAEKERQKQFNQTQIGIHWILQKVPQKFKQRNNSQTTFYLNEQLKKKPLEDQINHRTKIVKYQQKLQDQGNQLNQNITLQKQLIQKKDSIRISHFTPNRNYQNFYGSKLIVPKQPERFFDKIIIDNYEKLI